MLGEANLSDMWTISVLHSESAQSMSTLRGGANETGE